uniref:Uncharacterized protein n=1 Tax=Avena sativa TaxID=4498 RepID=A0ACD6AKZ2_AVESA
MSISLTLEHLKSENGNLCHHNLQARHVFLLLCQFANYMEVVRFPVYYPSEQEKEDPRVYAYNVRKLLATEGNLVLSNLGLAEKRVYHAALNGNSPRALHQKDD